MWQSSSLIGRYIINKILSYLRQEINGVFLFYHAQYCLTLVANHSALSSQDKWSFTIRPSFWFTLLQRSRITVSFLPASSGCIAASIMKWSIILRPISSKDPSIKRKIDTNPSFLWLLRRRCHDKVLKRLGKIPLQEKGLSNYS